MHVLALGMFLFLAQAPEQQSVVVCTDGMVFTGVIRDDVPAGIVLKPANGEPIFIQRARIKSVAKVAADAPAAVATPVPGPPPPPPAAVAPAAVPAPATNLAELWGKRDVLKMTPLEIEDELHWLVENRPPMGAPTLGIVFGTILTVAGIALITVGDRVWGYEYRFHCSTYNSCSANDLLANTLYVGLGTASLVIGVALLTLGIVFKILRGPTRNAMNARIQQLEDRRDRLETVERYKSSSLEPPPIGSMTVATF
jgi:hypothetical protein